MKLKIRPAVTTGLLCRQEEPRGEGSAAHITQPQPPAKIAPTMEGTEDNNWADAGKGKGETANGDDTGKEQEVDCGLVDDIVMGCLNHRRFQEMISREVSKAVAEESGKLARRHTAPTNTASKGKRAGPSPR